MEPCRQEQKENKLSRARDALARLGGHAHHDPAARLAVEDHVSFGDQALDELLPGALRRGALHEIRAIGTRDAASAYLFAAGIVRRSQVRADASAGLDHKYVGKVRARPWLWIQTQQVQAEVGMPYGPGLMAHGIDPADMLCMTMPSTEDALCAACEGLQSSALGAIVIASHGTHPCISLTNTRKLALMARNTGITCLLVQVAAADQPNAACTRWEVGAAPSTPLPWSPLPWSPLPWSASQMNDANQNNADQGASVLAGLPGPARLAVRLTRHRAGPGSEVFTLEWDRHAGCFRAVPAIPETLASICTQRPHPPASVRDHASNLSTLFGHVLPFPGAGADKAA